MQLPPLLHVPDEPPVVHAPPAFVGEFEHAPVTSLQLSAVQELLSSQDCPTEDCDSLGFPVDVPQLFESVHVLVCVKEEPHDCEDEEGDHAVQDQLGVHDETHEPEEHISLLAQSVHEVEYESPPSYVHDVGVPPQYVYVDVGLPEHVGPE